MSRTVWRAVAALALGSIATCPAAAQGWRVEASAGQADYREVGRDVGSTSAILSVERVAPTWLYLSTGAPLDSTGLPWAAAGLGSRLVHPGRGFSPGIDVGAHGYGYDSRSEGVRGGGATLVALPFVSFPAGPALLELHAGALRHSTVYDGESSSRTVLDAGARGSLPIARGASLLAESRVVRDAEASYPFLGVGIDLAVGAAQAWARGGRWMADALTGASWSVGASLPIARLATARVAYEQEGPDPLYWNGLRRGWSLGISRTLGRGAGARPRVPLAADLSAGTVTIRLPVGESPDAPAVAGDFSAWEPIPMRRVGDSWEARVPLDPGVYHYGFKRADGTWFLPESIPNQVDDGFGGRNAVLIVPPR